jgi:hypothetical protein
MIDTPQDAALFEQSWPEFLHQAETMPGLRRESTSRVNSILFGDSSTGMIVELFFESLEDLKVAMASPQGQTAGQTLQRITQGRMSLLLAQHTEDNLDRIRAHKG